MQHITKRCLHCNTEYTYCTYGNTPDEGYTHSCSDKYCSKCNSAIQEALGKIPKVFTDMPMDIEEPRLLKLFDKLRYEHEIRMEEAAKGRQFPLAVRFFPNAPFGDYDEMEVFIHNQKKYLVRWHDENPEKKDLSIMMEYNLIKEEFTEKPWIYDESDTYSKQRNVWKDLGKSVSATIDSMDKPVGKLAFMDFPYSKEMDLEWTLQAHGNLTSLAVEPPKKEHILREKTSRCSGKILRWMLANENNVTVSDTLITENLVDCLDYKYYYEQYDDEDLIKITQIDCY